MALPLVNRKQAARFFGVSAPTISNWIEKGCPVAEWSDSGRVKALRIDDLFEWRFRHHPPGLEQLDVAMTMFVKFAMNSATQHLVENLPKLIEAVVEDNGGDPDTLMDGARLAVGLLVSVLAAQFDDLSVYVDLPS